MISTANIFLVDDDLLSLNLYRKGLEKLGLKNITLFLNGTICLNNLYQKPNIIFLSYQINDSNSFDILKKIKQYESGTYVIIMSNQENINISIEAFKHGAFDCILKGEGEITKMKNAIERIWLIKK